MEMSLIYWRVMVFDRSNNLTLFISITHHVVPCAPYAPKAQRR